MDRNKIIEELGQYFSIVELVGPKEYKRDGDKCWRYLRTELLHTILVLRKDILDTPMTVNTWKSGGRFDERGFRVNTSEIVRSKTVSGTMYISPHMLGAAIDFDASGMTAEQARNRIKEKQDLLPYPIRLESGTNWVHIDVYDSLGSSKKVTEF